MLIIELRMQNTVFHDFLSLPSIPSPKGRGGKRCPLPPARGRVREGGQFFIFEVVSHKSPLTRKEMKMEGRRD